MITKMFAVFDSKVEAYMAPFFQASRGQAIRGFVDAAKDMQSLLGKHPSDFTLFEVGQFDDQKGLVTPHNTPISLGVLSELLAPANSNFDL